MDLATAIELDELIQRRKRLWKEITDYRSEASGAVYGTDGWGVPNDYLSVDELREHFAAADRPYPVAVIDAWTAVRDRIHELSLHNDKRTT